MDLKNTIEKRYSCRNFTEEQVPKEIIEELVARAGMAPSVNNTQPWKFVAVQNKEILHNLAKMVRDNIEKMDFKDDELAQAIKKQVLWYSTFFEDAPLVFFVLSHDYKAKIDDAVKSEDHKSINFLRNHPDIQSLGAAVQNLLLSTYDLGYASCWLSAPLVAEEEMEEALNIEKSWKIATMIAVGKAKSVTKQKVKKEVSEILEII